ETDVRRDVTTGVWRVDAKQVAHNGTIEIVDGNLSLNILNGEFYRGPLPDFKAADTPTHLADFLSYPAPSEISWYNLQFHCMATGQVARKQWMRENPKWVEWYNGFHRNQKAWDKLFERQDKCQANIDRAFNKCVQEHLTLSTSVSWLRKAWVRFRLEVLNAYSPDLQEYIPQECASIQMMTPIDFCLPAPFKVPTTYDADSCTWNFATNHSTTSARLYSLHQSHCDIRPKSECEMSRQAFDSDWEDIGIESNFELQQLIQEDESELMEQKGLMDPAIATLTFLVSFPHGDKEAFRSVVAGPKDVVSRFKSRPRPENGPYAFELRNVPGADGPINATLAYVQTPPRKSADLFILEEETMKRARLHPSLSLGNYRSYSRTVGSSMVTWEPVPELSSKDKERGEDCFGWGEGAAIREGVRQLLGRGGTEPSSKEGEMVKPLTYRSLNGPLHSRSTGPSSLTAMRAPARMGFLPGSNPDDVPTEPQTTSKDAVLTSLIPASLALLPCNPTFLVARDALIHADQLIFGGKYTCALWKGFAERGMGVNAHWATEMIWTPWGGGRRKDGFDVPEECGYVTMKAMKFDAARNKRDEL
ncbi:Fungalysin/Thermolysin Extracellular metalloproteinase 5, partial [Tulasnella sp. 417]